MKLNARVTTVNQSMYCPPDGQLATLWRVYMDIGLADESVVLKGITKDFADWASKLNVNQVIEIDFGT